MLYTTLIEFNNIEGISLCLLQEFLYLHHAEGIQLCYTNGIMLHKFYVGIREFHNCKGSKRSNWITKEVMIIFY